MTTNRTRKAAVLGLVCVVAGSCAPRTSPPDTTPTTAPPATVSTEAGRAVRDTHELLTAVLWVQTSAEYWALATAAYRDAADSLQRALADRSWTAAAEQTRGYEALPAAVILDLDETVLDNSALEGQLIRDRTQFSQPTWDAWVSTASAASVPGAKEFIAFAESRGVAMFYVTNRSVAEQPATLTNLQKLGIKASDDTVLCSGENGWTSDKTTRRAEVAKTHRVLLLIGDDMNDFVATTKLSAAERMSLARTHEDKWGTRWILIANPLYGSWERALTPGLADPAEVLKRKMDAVRGFR